MSIASWRRWRGDCSRRKIRRIKAGQQTRYDA
ncbi:hypothetical protein LTSEWAN_0823, partial [Salmonella enterica subsp. enterica serovar Wandsworth str. A4-580]